MADKKLYLITTIFFFSVNILPAFGQNKSDTTTALSTVAIRAQLYAPFKYNTTQNQPSDESKIDHHSFFSVLFNIGSDLLLNAAVPDFAASDKTDNYNFGIPLPGIYRNHTTVLEYNGYLYRLHRLPPDKNF